MTPATLVEVPVKGLLGGLQPHLAAGTVDPELRQGADGFGDLGHISLVNGLEEPTDDAELV